jgi:uncharacterized protein YndB with AHSA1/START domain
MYRITEWKADLRPGGKWSSVGVEADGTSFRVDGEYLEVDPPRLLVHTWIPSFSSIPQYGSAMGTLAAARTWLATARATKDGDRDAVKMRHSGFAGNAKSAGEHRKGWERVLGWLLAFLEKGETAETRKPASA